MNKVTIQGQDHPYKLTINAAKELQQEIEGKELADLDQLLVTLYYGIKGGYKSQGKETPFEAWAVLGDLIEFSEIEHIAKAIGGGAEKKN